MFSRLTVAALVGASLSAAQQEMPSTEYIGDRDLDGITMDMTFQEWREAKSSLPAYAWCVDWDIPEFTFQYGDPRPSRPTSLSGALLFKQDAAGEDVEVLMKGDDFLPFEYYSVDILTLYDTTAKIDNYCRITGGEPKTIAENVLTAYADKEGNFPYQHEFVDYRKGQQLNIHPNNEGGSDVSNRPRDLYAVVNDESGKMVACCPIRKTISYLFSRTIKRSWKEKY